MTALSVVFTAYQRPHYLKETLDSWAHVRGISSISMSIFIEPSDLQDDMIQVVHESKLSLDVVLNKERLGVLVNAWRALNFAFFQTDADFTILAEEDVIVSSDTLEYFQYQIDHYSCHDALGVCAYSGRDKGDTDKTHLSFDFSVLLWGTWYDNWIDCIKDNWDKDYSTNNGTPGVEAGWDWHLARLSKKFNRPFIHPEVSRSKHIGEFGGMHTTPETHAALRCPTFQL